MLEAVRDAVEDFQHLPGADVRVEGEVAEEVRGRGGHGGAAHLDEPHGLGDDAAAQRLPHEHLPRLTTTAPPRDATRAPVAGAPGAAARSSGPPGASWRSNPTARRACAAQGRAPGFLSETRTLGEQTWQSEEQGPSKGPQHEPFPLRAAGAWPPSSRPFMASGA